MNKAKNWEQLGTLFILLAIMLNIGYWMMPFRMLHYFGNLAFLLAIFCLLRTINSLKKIFDDRRDYL